MFFAVVFSIVSGVLYYLSFPPAAANFIIWFFLLPLAHAAKGRPAREKALFGFLAGVTGFGLNLYWIFPTVKNSGENFAVAGGALLTVAVFFSLFSAIFALLLDERPVVAASAGTLLSWLGAKIPVGMPWCALYVSQAKTPVFLQITRITGPHFLMFLIIFFNLSLYAALRKKKIMTAGPAALLILLTAAYGIFFHGVKPSGHVKKITVVQTNVPQSEKWNSLKAARIMAMIKKYAAGNSDADLTVFPEACLPGIVNYDADVTSFLNNMELSARSPVIMGAAFYDAGRLYNSALMVKGQTGYSYYFKRRLVPFGEYIPFGKFLEKYINVLNELGGFSPGLKRRLLKARGMSINPLICSESVYPSLWKGGGNLAVNISNDVWYGRTAASRQHLWHAVCAAAARGTPVIFADNTGPSAIIDAAGVITAESKMEERTVIKGSVALPSASGFYARHFDITLPVMFLIIILGAADIIIKKRRKNG